MPPTFASVGQRLITTLALALTLCLAPAKASAEQVLVFAAASLANALDNIASQWQADSGHSAVISYAGSSALARQIQQGAPADLFISASSDWMDEIEASGDVRPGTRQDLLGNQLVLIAHGRQANALEITAELDLTRLLNGERLAMALVDAVPAGVYGKAALTHLGQWEAVQAQVAQSDNVRAALHLVATGEAPYGIVYATDAQAEDNVSIVGVFPANSHAPILYPAALLTQSSNKAASAFLDYLRSDPARKLFEAEGFQVLD